VVEAASAEVTEGRPPLITIPSEGRPLEFAGVLLAEKSTERPEVQRWTDLLLYGTTDGTGRYVLVSVGRSVRYHVYGGMCNQGVRTHTRKFPKDAEPCPRCRPANWRQHPGDYDMETDNYKTRVCRDAFDLIEKLGETPERKDIKKGSVKKNLSNPAQQLLEQAAEVDANIARAMQVPERL
jgi:hypothetical protein